MAELIIDYLDQLIRHAKRFKVDLKSAFVAAGVPDSTYYRAINRKTHLQWETAMRIAGVMQKLRDTA